MTIKEIFKKIEGIAMLAAFGLIIITGAKMFAWLGLAAYVVINLKGGVINIVKAIKFIISKFKKNGKAK